MKWIKASERLPDAGIKKHLKIGDKLAIGRWLGKSEGEKYFSIHYFGEDEPCEITLQEVEWLDETQPEQNSGQEEKAVKEVVLNCWNALIDEDLPEQLTGVMISKELFIQEATKMVEGAIFMTKLYATAPHTVSSEEGKELFNDLDGAILTQPMSDKKEAWKEYFINNVNRTKNQLLVFDVIWKAATRPTPSTPQGDVEQEMKREDYVEFAATILAHISTTGSTDDAFEELKSKFHLTRKL